MIRVLIGLAVIIAVGIGLYVTIKNNHEALSARLTNALSPPQLPIMGCQPLNSDNYWGQFFILTLPTGERVLVSQCHAETSMLLLPPLPVEKRQ